VRVGRVTITTAAFYERFFELMKRYLGPRADGNALAQQPL